jgi:tyrosyl-tRNA synthetase
MHTVEEQLAVLSRGVEQIIPMDEFRAKLEKSVRTGKPLRIKLGLDPTAPDIHLGFAVVLRKLRQFQDYGHTIDLVIGDFTGMIGDPSGKSATRPRLTEEQVIANAHTYETQLCKILIPERTVMHRNSTWLGQIKFAELIEISSKITVARLLEGEFFSSRLEAGKPLHLHEVLYPIAQAYDSVALNSDVELGGMDQTFNILMGRDLQREFDQEPQIGMFLPLLVGIDGHQKMSKSLGNYVGIFESPAEMFGKTMSIPDESLTQWYELCTDVPMDEVKALIADNPMEAKKRLAESIAAMYHSAEEAKAARAAWEAQFSRREVPTDMPTVRVSADETGAAWIVGLIKQAGLATGTNDARRKIQDGGVQVNGERISDVEARIALEGEVILKVGRKYARIEKD